MNVVAAKLHFTDNNLAGSIYLDARSNTKKEIPEKIPMANLEWGLSLFSICNTQKSCAKPIFCTTLSACTAKPF